MNISYTFWAYPYAFLVNLLLLFLTAGIGRIIVGQIRLPLISKFATYSFIGMLATVGVCALIACNGISYELPLVLLALYLFARSIQKDGWSKARFNVSLQSVKECTMVAVPIVGVTLTVVLFFFIPPSSEYIHFNNLDFEYYSYLARRISQNHLESNYWEDIFLFNGSRMPYHYTDIWLCHIVSSICGLIPYYVYILIVKVYSYIIISLLMYSFVREYVKAFVPAIIISLGVLFIGSTFFYTFPVGALPWYLDIDFFPSIINYHGGVLALTFICLVITIMWQAGSSSVNYALMACAGAVHLLLYPVFISFIGLNLFIKFILYLREQIPLKNVIISFVALVCCGAFFLYTMKISAKFPGSSQVEIIHSLKVPFIIFMRSLLELAAPALPVIGLAFLCWKNFKEKRDVVINILLFALSAMAMYAFVYESIRGDIWQIKIMCELPVIFFLGYLGLVTLLKNKPGRIAAMITFIAISGFFSFYIKQYYFGPGPVFGNGVERYKVKVRKDDIDDVSALIKDKGNGLALIKDKTFPPTLNIPTAIYLTEACNMNNVIYRLNTTAKDTSTLLKKEYLKLFIYSTEPVYLPGDSDKLIPLIDRYNLDWVYTDKNYYLPDFLRNTYKNEHNFGEFTIYTKN